MTRRNQSPRPAATRKEEEKLIAEHIAQHGVTHCAPGVAKGIRAGDWRRSQTRSTAGDSAKQDKGEREPACASASSVSPYVEREFRKLYGEGAGAKSATKSGEATNRDRKSQNHVAESNEAPCTSLKGKEDRHKT